MKIEEIILAKKLAGGSSPSVDIEQLNATENGTYSEPGKAYSPVIVEVPEPTLITKSITANGTYSASDDNADGYSQVTVAVDGFKKKSIANTPTDIASFDDGTANPMPSLEISIEPVQSGSGDPSPSNVRPISGWSEANVTRTGKNLFNIHIDKNTALTTIVLNKPITSYITISAVENNVSISEAIWRIAVKLKNGDVYYVGDSTYQYTFPRTLYGTEENPIVEIQYRGQTITSGSYDVQIEFGQTATTYSPYQGSTTSIPFIDDSDNPITVYGGTLNVTSGELRVDRVKRALSANDTFVKLGDTTVYLDTWLDIVKPTSPELGLLDCSHYKEVLQSSATDSCIAKPINNRAIIFYDSVHATSVNDFKAYIAEQINNNTPIEVVYKLATPQTYQLTPAQVSTLLGQNNIFADCGQILEGEYFVTL